MRVGFCCLLKIHFKNLSSSSNAMVHNVAEFVIRSFWLHPTLYVYFQINFFNVNNVYLLNPQLSACTPVQLDPLISHPDAREGSVFCSHVNDILLTWVQWNMNARFGLFTHGKLFFMCSSTTTFFGSRIATLTKPQLIYCMQSTEEILSFPTRLQATRVGNAGISRVQGLKLAPRSCGSLHICGIQVGVTIIQICT